MRASRFCLARAGLLLALGGLAAAASAAPPPVSAERADASSAAVLPTTDAGDGCQAPGATLTLAAARLLAERCNADLRAARRAEEASRADIRIAGQRPNPVLSLGVQNINPHAGVGAGSWRNKTVDSIARVDQLVETANKAGLRVDAARAANVAAGEQVQAVAAQQIAAVEQAFYEAAVSQQRVDVLTQTLALYARTEEANRTRLKSGDIARADLTKLQLEALRAQSELREARADHQRDMAELARRLGIPGTLADTTLAPDWPEPGQAVPAFDDSLLQQRPDVTAAEARLRSAQAARELARAGRVPDVTVGAQAEHYPTSPANQQGTGNSFGVFVSIPLYVRHSYGGEAARAEVDYYAALDERNRVLLAAGNEVGRLRAALDAARQSWLQMRDSVLPAAEQVAADAEFAYGKGATGVLDLLDARRALRQTRLDAAQAQGAYARALSAYLAAIRTTTTASASTGPTAP